MFRTSLRQRTARGMAVGALILSLSATTFGGSASAAPSADDTSSCSTLAHARNDSVHRVHAAWIDFRDQLKDLARDARELERDARHSKAATEMTVDARSEVADARAKLQEIWTTAHEKLQNGADLGQTCADKDNDQEKDEDTKTSSTTANTTTTSATTRHEDADENKDEDKDDETKTTSNTTTTSTTNASTTDLVAKYKDVVDQAIKDMQAVLDDVTATVAKMTTAAQSTDSSLAAKVKAERAKEKDARNNEHGRSSNGKGSRG